MIAALPLPAPLSTIPGLALRRATSDDLDPLMRLLSDDAISASRGDRAAEADRLAYERALNEVRTDGSNDILVVHDELGALIGTMQLTRIPGMARRGATRLQIEAVRVSSAQRSVGVGTAMMRWILDVAVPATGAALVQLTSDAQREAAHRFYERLGFVPSHVGFKRQM